MIFTACQSGSDIEEDNGGTPFVPEITISPKDLTFGCNGGEQAVDITANFEYEVAERASWLTVEQTETGLLVTAKESKNTSERTTYISIINEKYSITKTIDIVQEAWVPKIELAQQSIEVEFEPAEYEVGVTSPYSWEATTKNDWIVIESETGIAGEEVLRFSTKRNEEEKERKGTITLKNSDYNLVAELYVTQKAFVPDELIIEPESLAFAVEGGTKEVAITANFEYEYSTNVDWLTIKKSEKGITVTVPNYVEVDERSAEITISSERYGISKTVKVTQGAFTPVLTILPEVLNFAVEGGTQEMTITANFEYEVDSDASWLSFERYDKGVKVTAIVNNIFEERTTEITISNYKYNLSKIVRVSQNGILPGTNIFYSSSNGEIVEPFKTDVFGANIISNTYTDGQGLLIFDTPITSIGSSAFYNCSSLTSITIPNSVTSIGEKIFADCSNLISVSIPNSVTTIGKQAFKNCCQLTNIIIPDNVIHLGTGAFYQCSNLESVTLPNGIAEIRDSTFNGCSKLKSIFIPSSVTSIGAKAFYDCTGELIINSRIVEADYIAPNYPMYSGDSWLYGSKFTKLTIGDNITKIGDWTFSYCKSLTSVTIPESITTIGHYAFCYCTSLTNITILDSSNMGGNIKIGNFAFYGCSGLISTTIPNSIASIGYEAFYDCTGELIINSKIIEKNYDSNTCPSYENGWLYGAKFTKLTIGDNITDIGDYTFYNCSCLTSVTIGKNVTSIGSKAFYNCTGELIINSKIIEKNYDSNTCPSYENGWLYGTKFTKLTIGDNITDIGACTFYNCKSLTSVTIGNSVTSIGAGTFRDCTSLTSVTIPDSVTSIRAQAFANCSSLTSVTIGDGVTSIGWYAFAGCSSLTSVTIPNSVTSIGIYAFEGCTSLISVTIPDSVTSIGIAAFYNCKSLTSVTIGNSVTSIGAGTFRDCTSLKEVYCKPTTPPTGGDYMFSYYYYDYDYVYGSGYWHIGCKIYVPRNSVSAYKSAQYWKDYKSDIEGYDF